ISADIYSLVLATALITMILTPFAIQAAPAVARWFRRGRPAAVQASDLPTLEPHDHIIIAGYGRVGRYTADLLRSFKLPFVVIKLDDHLVDQMRGAGVPAIYGDASSPVVLEAAGVHMARLLLIG